MAPSRAAVRPLSSLKRNIRQCRFQRAQSRSLQTQTSRAPARKPLELMTPAQQYAAAHPLLYKGQKLFERPVRKSDTHKKIEVFRQLPSTWKKCKDPVAEVHTTQIAALDPTGARTRLFAKENPERARVGDILLVRQKSGDPYAGVCLNIRKRGIDTSILLRNQMTRIGVEMWYKIYNPNVTGIEIVQRKAKRARRNKLYYMRQPKHDIGSVENIVRQYQRQRAMLGSSGQTSQAANHSRKKLKHNRKR